MDESKHANLWGTKPLGIEVQTIIWGFDTPELENIMFVKWLLINKSGESIEDTYISMWSDPDVGDATNDYVGCDTTLSLGYCYNGRPIDGDYGVAVPCVGYDFFQGPIVESLGDSAFASGQFIPDYRNLPMTSFVKYTGGSAMYYDPRNAADAYSYMRGLMATGDPWIDIDGNITKFLYTGDPVTQTGYTEYDDDVPGDRRFLMNSGPFSLETWQDINGDNFPQVGEPGVQEIVGAIIIERSSDHLSSIDAVKTLDRIAQSQYLYGNNRPSLMLISPRDGDVFSDTINIIWENISGYPEPDKIIIEFSNDDGASWTVVETLMGNPGFYQMLLPDQQDAPLCKIRLTGYIKPDQLARVTFG